VAYSRAPSEAETQAGVAFLAEQATAASNHVPADPKAGESQPAQVALAHLCQALVSSNGFLYVD
jgi:hypothetical protein